MSEVQNEINECLSKIEEHEEHVLLGEALERLKNNPDFKKVFLDEFLVKEAARYIRVSTDPSLTPEARADAVGTAQSAGYVGRYMHKITNLHNYAKSSIHELKEHIEELRSNSMDEE